VAWLGLILLPRSSNRGLLALGLPELLDQVEIAEDRKYAPDSEGQHPPIVDQDLWDRVQQSLREHLGSARTKRTRQSSEASLAGKLFDDRGNRMSPTWARKGSKRWRYYVSQAALQGDKSKAGSIVRVPAAEVEALVTEGVGKLSADRPTSQTDIRDWIDRVAIGGTAIQIRLSEVGEGDDSEKTLTLPWTAPSPYRRREIIQGASDATTGARPMRANARAILIEALGDAHRWLDELLSDPRQTLETLASREGKTERRQISLRRQSKDACRANSWTRAAGAGAMIAPSLPGGLCSTGQLRAPAQMGSVCAGSPRRWESARPRSISISKAALGT